MKNETRLRIAIQKSGRLNSDSMDLLYKCGLKIKINANALYCHAENIPIDILFVRDNDIPTLVMDSVCDLGIIGENVLLEQAIELKEKKLNQNFEVIKKLGFSRCRLSVAISKEKSFSSPNSLQGLRIATSYPNLLNDYLIRNNIDADVMIISGSVEVAPRLDMSDAICDLVSTGQTLEENNLKEVDQILQSQAVLIKTTKNKLNNEKLETLELLQRRIDGVLKAQESKYIMFHAPRNSLKVIKEILPGCESPTIMPLENTNDKVAIHVVSSEGVFWTTLEKLKQVGASSILVLSIEKMMN